MIDNFWYNTVDILEKQVNAEVKFIIKGFKTNNGFLIDSDGDTEILIPKKLYKELIELFDKNKCKIELVYDK